MSRATPNWRIFLALLFSVALALAPAVAEARAGSSAGHSFSGFGSRGSRTFENNGAAPLSRTMTPQATPTPGFGAPSGYPAYGGGSFFMRHPFLTGIAGGLFGSWLFGGSSYAGTGGSAGTAMFGSLLHLLILGLLIYGAVRLFRGRGFSFAPRMMAQPVGAAVAPAAQFRGRDIAIADADLTAFQRLHAAIQEAWSRGDLGQMRQLMTPEMLSYFSEELTRNASQGVQNIVTDVTLVQGDLSEGWEESDLQYATARMRWRAVDFLARVGRAPSDPGYIADGDPRQPVEATEMWTFVRRRGANWLLSAIQQV